MPAVRVRARAFVRPQSRSYLSRRSLIPTPLHTVRPGHFLLKARPLNDAELSTLALAGNTTTFLSPSPLYVSESRPGASQTDLTKDLALQDANRSPLGPPLASILVRSSFRTARSLTRPPALARRLRQYIYPPSTPRRDEAAPLLLARPMLARLCFDRTKVAGDRRGASLFCCNASDGLHRLSLSLRLKL